jgi:HAMP domain-containing protein
MVEEVKKAFDIRNLWSDTTTTLAIIGFFVWATWLVTTERYKVREELAAKIAQHEMWAESELEKRLGALHERISNMRSTMNQQAEILERINVVLTRVRERQSYVIENIWTKDDHNNWCRQMELANPSYKCQDYQTGKRLPFTGGDGSLNDSGQNDLDRALTEDATKLWQNNEKRHTGNAGSE